MVEVICTFPNRSNRSNPDVPAMIQVNHIQFKKYLKVVMTSVRPTKMISTQALLGKNLVADDINNDLRKRQNQQRLYFYLLLCSIFP